MLPLEHPDFFQVYDTFKIALAPGERLRTTDAITTITGKKISNGMDITVQGFTRKGDIKLKDGRVLPMNAAHFDYGYAATSWSSQSKDKQRVFLAQSLMSRPASFLEQFYVSITRGIEMLKIYTDDVQVLKEMVMESGVRASATERMKRQVNERLQPKWAAQERVRRVQQSRQRIAELQNAKSYAAGISR
jgi:hypothetical protein